MRKIEIELVGFKDLVEGLTIDGKRAKAVKGKPSSYVIETEKDSCEVAIYKSHFYAGKNWFWWNLLYFVISIFGLFDIKQDKKFTVVDVKLNIDATTDGKIVLTRNEFVDGGKVLSWETSSSVEEVSNVQFHDKEARKKHAKMKKFKIAATILSLVLAVVLIIVL